MQSDFIKVVGSSTRIVSKTFLPTTIPLFRMDFVIRASQQLDIAEGTCNN